MTARIDHIIWTTPDLAMGVERMEDLLGTPLTPGGVHPRWGTRNCVASLGPSTYLEVIGPDPETNGPAPDLWGIGESVEPRLARFCASGVDLPPLVRRAASAGVPLGEVAGGSRANPDGAVLRWTGTDPETMISGGLVPFFIDWGDTPHPAVTSAPAGALIDLTARHPDAAGLRVAFDALGLDGIEVEAGRRPELIARVETARGVVEIR